MWRESLTQEQDAALKLSQKKDAYKTADKAQYKGRFDFAWRNAAIRYKHRDRYGRKCRKYGGIYPINEYPGAIAHPRCRCVPIPVEDDDPRVAGMSGGKTAVKYRGKIPGEKGIDIGGESGIINYSKETGFFKVDGTVERIAPEEVFSDLDTSNIGRETLNALESLPRTPIFDYYAAPEGIKAQEENGTIRIFVKNCKDLKATSCALIHEMTHYRYGIGQSQWSECVYVCQELKHRRQRDYLTFAEKRMVVRAVKAVYPEYNWRKGGLVHGRRVK